jgi:hypothetical protein
MMVLTRGVQGDLYVYSLLYFLAEMAVLADKYNSKEAEKKYRKSDRV